MVDVTVDAKSMPKLPYDPKDIPEAVRKRAAAVDALYNSTALSPANGQANGSDGPPVPSVQPESAHPAHPAESAPVPPPQVPSTDVPSPSKVQPAPADQAPSPPPSPPPVEGENLETWKARANGYQGRYNAAQRQIAEMQEQMMQLGNELLHAQRALSERMAVQPSSQPPAASRSYLTEEDVKNYGNELIDFTQRAATQVVAPHLERLETENADLRQQIARERRYSLDQMLEQAVPNFREIDRDPRWHQWLLGIDPFTGYVRQQLLDDAKAAASAPRVISFFKRFLAEEVATGQIEPAQSSPAASAPREPAVDLASLAAPGRARPATGGESSLPPEAPIYTRAQIAELYSQHRRKAFVGREAEWARIEQDIIAAGREGRIR